MVSEFVNDLQLILTNPYSLLFLALFALGYLLKEKTKFPNKLIPIVLLGVGALLAGFMLGFSLTSVLIGFVLASVIMANYETVRNTMQWYLSGGKDTIRQIFQKDPLKPDDE